MKTKKYYNVKIAGFNNWRAYALTEEEAAKIEKGKINGPFENLTEAKNDIIVYPSNYEATPEKP